MLLQHRGGSDLSLPDLIYKAGLNCLSWRFPQEAPWFAKVTLWSRSGSPWPLLPGWLVSISSYLNKDFQIIPNTATTPHTLSMKCVKLQKSLIATTYYKSWMWRKILTTKERGLTPSSSCSVDPHFCVTILSKLLTLALSYCQSKISNSTPKILRHFIFNLISTVTKYTLGNLFKDFFLC